MQTTTLQQIVKNIKNGSSIYIGGGPLERAPMSFIRELIRQEKQNLEIVAVSTGLQLDLLTTEQTAQKAEIANCDLEHLGPAINFEKAIEENFLQVEDYSAIAMQMRLYGGAIGSPFMPVRTMLGTSHIKKTNLKTKQQKTETVQCPFTGEIVNLVPSINPDFAIIHAQKADKEGNIQIKGPLYSDLDGLKSADIKIVTVEEIVEKIKEPTIEGILIDYIIKSKQGAWPTALKNHYKLDTENIKIYINSSLYPEDWHNYKKNYVLKKEEQITKQI